MAALARLLLVALLIPTFQVNAQSLRIEWSALTASRELEPSLTEECLAGTPEGGVAVLFSSPQSEIANGSPPFLLLLVDSKGGPSEPSLLHLEAALNITGSRGGCASVSSGDLFVVGSQHPKGELAFFSVDNSGKVKRSGELLGASSGWTARRVIQTSTGKLLALGDTGNSRSPSALAFDPDGRIEWKLDDSEIRGVMLRDAIEAANGDLILTGVEISDRSSPLGPSRSVWENEPINLWLGRVSGAGKLLRQRRLDGIEGRLMLSGGVPVLLFDRGQPGDSELVRARLSEDLTFAREAVLLEHFGRLFTLEIATLEDGSVIVAQWRIGLPPQLLLFGPEGTTVVAELSDERLGTGLFKLVSSKGSVLAVSTVFEIGNETDPGAIGVKTRVTKIVVDAHP